MSAQVTQHHSGVSFSSRQSSPSLQGPSWYGAEAAAVSLYAGLALEAEGGEQRLQGGPVRGAAEAPRG